MNHSDGIRNFKSVRYFLRVLVTNYSPEINNSVRHHKKADVKFQELSHFH